MEFQGFKIQPKRRPRPKGPGVQPITLPFPEGGGSVRDAGQVQKAPLVGGLQQAEVS